MKLNTIIAAAVLAASSQVAIARDDVNWVKIAKDANGGVALIDVESAIYYEKLNALSMLISNVGADNITVVGRMAVCKSDCDAKEGTLFVQNTDGTVIGTPNFAFGAPNVGSLIAETICTIGGVFHWK